MSNISVLLKSEDGDFEGTITHLRHRGASRCRSSIRLQFGATPIMLQGWSIVDEEGHNITIELLSPRIGMPLEDALFNPPPNPGMINPRAHMEILGMDSLSSETRSIRKADVLWCSIGRFRS
jgi:hypothetical protein